MKKVLLQAFLSTTILTASLLPNSTSAQCSCSGGSPATQLSYTVTLPPTNQSNTTITFPKFDPAIGTLTCVRLDDTLSIVSSTGIRNYDPMATEYEFQLTVNTQVTGPSLSRTNFKNSQYGPDILEAFGTVGDSINYGPDTIYNNWPSTRTNTSNMTPYLGPGTVDFTYTIGGGVIAVGGANYNAQVRTTTWGVFKLTYFWCPNSVLANGIRNLTVKNAGQNVELEWLAPEEAQINNFKIETSTDGKSFENLKQGTSSNVIKIASAKYAYQYRPDRPIDRKLYFRVRYEHDGQIRYSEMKWVMPDATSTRPSLSVYPNPVIRNIRLAIAEPVSGEVEVELSNQLGQVVMRKKQLLSHNNLIEVVVSDLPPPGIYFVKARINNTGKVYSGKLLFSR